MKISKEQLAEDYAHNYFVMQDNHYNGLKQGFLAGYEEAQPKWISVSEQIPNNERVVIIKTFDYRRPNDNVTEVSLGYFDHEEKEWYHHNSDLLVNSGHGWMIIDYMEIPQ